MPIDVFFLVVMVIPLAVAGHNIAMGLVGFICLCWLVLGDRGALISSFAQFKLYWIPAVMFSGFMLLACFFNPENMSAKPGRFFSGHLGFMFFPPVLAACFHNQLHQFFKRYGNILACLLFTWGLVSLSQYIWGWRLKGSSILWDQHRAYGFYSHPLTLAYITGMLWPMCSYLLIEKRNLTSLFMCIGVGLCIIGSASRMIQILAVATSCFQIMVLLSGKQRLAAALAVTLGMIGVFSTENRISHRFKTEHIADRQSEYPDDRVAFWHAHWEMVKERPITGHGSNVGTEYRVPYYEKIGLTDFAKKYEAHNQYLQVLTNSGVLGLFAFGFWLLGCFLIAKRIHHDVIRSIVMQTLVFFCFSGLTQNAFQDAEVRYVMILLMGVVCILSWKGSETVQDTQLARA